MGHDPPLRASCPGSHLAILPQVRIKPSIYYHAIRRKFFTHRRSLYDEYIVQLPVKLVIVVMFSVPARYCHYCNDRKLHEMIQNTFFAHHNTATRSNLFLSHIDILSDTVNLNSCLKVNLQLP